MDGNKITQMSRWDR